MEDVSWVALPEREGGREEREAMLGFEVGMEGEERSRVTSGVEECRWMKTSQSSSVVTLMH